MACDARKVLSDLNIAGKIINSQFFPFNLYDGTNDIVVVANAGVIVPNGAGTNNDGFTRYYLNRATGSQTVTTTTVFSVANNWVGLDEGSGTESFVESFNNTTDWTLVTGTTADYTIDFIHGLNTNDIEYVIYDENNNFVFACVSQESNTRLRITVNDPVTRFAGRITINKEG